MTILKITLLIGAVSQAFFTFTETIEVYYEGWANYLSSVYNISQTLQLFSFIAYAWSHYYVIS